MPHQPQIIRRSHALRAAALLAVAGCLPLMAASVMVVLSSEAVPYRTALGELTRRLSADGHTVQTVLLAQFPATDLSRTDCVVAVGTAATTAMYDHGGLTMPLVFCMVTDGSGFDRTRAISGVETKVPITAQFQVIAEALPRVRRVGLLHTDDAAGTVLVANAQAALPPGWELKAVAATADRLAEQIAAVTTGVDLVWTSPDGALYNDATVRALLLNAMRRRVPVFGFSPSFVRAGALLGVAVDPAAQGAQAALLASEALASERPIKIQRLSPTFQIAVNLVVAQKLGLTLPDGLVERSAHVFQAGR